MRLNETALSALNKLEDRRGGFFDKLYLGGRELAVNDSKKANYNAVCLIALLDRWPKKRLLKHVDYLVERCQRNDFIVPSFEGRPEATWGEQGLLLWALSKAKKKGFRQARKACEALHENIVSSAGEKGLPHVIGSQWFVPMDNAFLLDGLLEHGDAEGARVFADALLDSCNPPVFLIERDGKTTNRVSFNNLAYPVHALSRYCLKHGSAQAKKTLGESVEGLLGLQGPQGQWWWTYNASGDVVQKYPVYSVHQDGIAVMALKQAAGALPEKRARAKRAIQKSVDWVSGCNELNQSLADEKHGVVWRSIRCPFLVQKTKRFLPFFPEFGLRIKKEMRSYHAAWISYAASV